MTAHELTHGHTHSSESDSALSVTTSFSRDTEQKVYQDWLQPDDKEANLKLKSNMFTNIEADQLVLWKVVLSSSSKSYYSLLLKSSIPIRSPRVLKEDIAKQDFLKTMRCWRWTLYQTILLHPNPRIKPFTLSYQCLSYGETFIAHHFYSAVPPPSLPSFPILELNCFVHGDDPGHVFIAATETVGTLRDAIKDNPSTTSMLTPSTSGMFQYPSTPISRMT
jgi:hypothetical protein